MDNQQALLEAIIDGILAEVQRLVDAGGVDLNPPVGPVFTHPLLLASAHGGVEIARLLLDHGADVNQVDVTGWTALMYATSNNYSRIVLLLLQRGANVNARGNSGSTALHLTAQRGLMDVIRVLLDHGADRTLKNKDGKTAEEVAREKGEQAAAKLVRDYVPVPVFRASDIDASSQPSPAASIAPPLLTGQTNELASLRAQLQATTDELAAARAQYVTLRQELEAGKATQDTMKQERDSAREATRRAEAEAAMEVRLADQRTTELRACETQLAAMTTQKHVAAARSRARRENH